MKPTRLALMAVAPFLFAGTASAQIITQITTHGAADSGPAWSPDGRQIAFVSDRAGSRDIWLIDADGQNPVQLTFDGADDGAPSFSPDGQWIIFNSDRDGVGEELYRVSVVGGSPLRVTDNTRRDIEPAWAPSGDQVICHTWMCDNWEIAIYDAFTGVLNYLATDHPADDGEPGFGPVVERFVFQSARSGNRDIYTAPIPAGAGGKQLTLHPGDDLQPSWSAAHGLICFSSDRGVAGASRKSIPDGPLTDEMLAQLPVDIWIMNENGGELTQITHDAHNNHRARWSPDGSRLVFQSLKSGNWDLYIADDLHGPIPVRQTSWGAIKSRMLGR